MWPDGGIKNSPIIAIFATVVFTLIGTFSKSPKNYITFDKKCFHQDLTKIAQSGHNECVSCTLLALSLEWGLFQFKLTGVGGAKLLPLVTLPLCLVRPRRYYRRPQNNGEGVNAKTDEVVFSQPIGHSKIFTADAAVAFKTFILWRPVRWCLFSLTRILFVNWKLILLMGNSELRSCNLIAYASLVDFVGSNCTFYCLEMHKASCAHLYLPIVIQYDCRL